MIETDQGVSDIARRRLQLEYPLSFVPLKEMYMRSNLQPRLTRKSKTSALICLAAAAVPQPILAANRTYTGDTGLWSDTLNWNPVGVPISTDSVFLQTSGSNAVTVTYDASVTNTTIAGLTIDTTNA